MKAERTYGGSVIEPLGHSLTLHQHSDLLKFPSVSCCCCWGTDKFSCFLLSLRRDHLYASTFQDYILYSANIFQNTQLYNVTFVWNGGFSFQIAGKLVPARKSKNVLRNAKISSLQISANKFCSNTDLVEIKTNRGAMTFWHYLRWKQRNRGRLPCLSHRWPSLALPLFSGWTVSVGRGVGARSSQKYNPLQQLPGCFWHQQESRPLTHLVCMLL